MVKQLLMGTMAFAFTVSASAADITNPFYLPTKGQVGSITSASFHKNEAKNSEFLGKSYDKVIHEELQYGLMDNLALVGGIGNTFDRTKESPLVSDKSDGNTHFDVGMAWNVLTGPARLQVSARYGQDKLIQTEKGEYKYVRGEVKAGYQFKKFLPYVSVGEELPVAQSKGDDKPAYNAKIGVYQGACEVWALDTGIRWIHDENGEQNGYNVEVEASYYLTPKSALSLYGTYLLKGEAKYDTDLYDKSVGMRLRWFF